jgi:hypothetical protein
MREQATTAASTVNYSTREGEQRVPRGAEPAEADKILIRIRNTNHTGPPDQGPTKIQVRKKMIRTDPADLPRQQNRLRTVPGKPINA